ncbi:MAG TPA: GNAT family N-acetyltransferase [Ferruginibacter sp.]|jgi:ribosomal protein S18 acetylase RimI-like enzyme|nr:GNAT family N-acetyltransferase [Ferruginibacter sp.]
MITIKKVGATAVAEIINLANISWKPTYKHILSKPQMDYMMQLLYSPHILQKQITEEHHQFIIVMDEKSNIGFASYFLINPNDIAAYKLQKLYINPDQQGKGIGKKLIDYIIEDIKPKGARSLELNVNRSNKAIKFYQKLGFAIIREEDIDIGNNYFMNDYVMRKVL